MKPRPALVLLLGASVLLAPAPARSSAPEPPPGKADRALNADPKDVFEALKSALREWRIQKADLEDGIVKTAWETTERLREEYRERVIAEFRQDGYVTVLAVRHERQRKMKELRQTVTAGAAPWQDWKGDPRLADDVIRSVEQALGLQAQSVDLDELSGRPPAPKGIVVEPERIVPPGVAARVNDLKAKRRSLVAEVKAIDGRILAAVYDGKYEEIREEVDELKARKAALEKQVAAIDREILSLVLADDSES